jgi:phage shock protein C
MWRGDESSTLDKSYSHNTEMRPSTTMNDIHNTFRQQGLVRPRDGKVLGGVIAGLGRRFGIDPWPARLLFVLALMILPGSQLLVYPILWILMPLEVEGESPVTPATSAPAV